MLLERTVCLHVHMQDLDYLPDLLKKRHVLVQQTYATYVTVVNQADQWHYCIVESAGPRLFRQHVPGGKQGAIRSWDFLATHGWLEKITSRRTRGDGVRSLIGGHTM